MATLVRRGNSHYHKYTKVCAYCSARFGTDQHRQIYCPNGCAALARNGSVELPRGGRKPTKVRPLIECPSCRVKFRPQYGHQRFCCYICRRQYERAHRKYESNGRLHGGDRRSGTHSEPIAYRKGGPDGGRDARCPNGHCLRPQYFELDGRGGLIYRCPDC